MDKRITDFLTTELKIGKYLIAPIDMLLFLAAPVFALMMRLSVASYTASEMASYMKLTASLKIVTGIFDVLLALLATVYVYRLTGRKIRAYLTYAIVLMLPVLAAGSAMWGMGDSIYVFFALLSLFLLGEGKGNASLISYGVSLFLSRYAFFLLPVYAIAFLQKKNKLIFFLFPLGGVALRNGFVNWEGAPAFPVFEAERLFLSGRGETVLSYNWPNIYQMIGTDKFVIEYGMAAKCLAIVLMAVIVVMVAEAEGWEISRANLTHFAALLCMLFPFVMPQMDERCGLLADILLVVVAMKHPRLYYVSVMQIILSYMSYSAYFRGEAVVPLSYAAIVNLFLIAVMIIFVGEGRILQIRLVKDAGDEKTAEVKNPAATGHQT